MHNPNPWAVAKRKIGGTTVLGIVDSDGKPVQFDSETMRRIVACVNFCRGVPTETLIREESIVKYIRDATIQVERNAEQILAGKKGK